jgi:hypothetical protein
LRKLKEVYWSSHGAWYVILNQFKFQLVLLGLWFDEGQTEAVNNYISQMVMDGRKNDIPNEAWIWLLSL